MSCPLPFGVNTVPASRFKMKKRTVERLSRLVQRRTAPSHWGGDWRPQPEFPRPRGRASPCSARSRVPSVPWPGGHGAVGKQTAAHVGPSRLRAHGTREGGLSRGWAGGQLCSEPGLLLLRQPPHPAAPSTRCCQSPEVSFFFCLGLFPAFPLNWCVGSSTHSPSSSDPPGLLSDATVPPGCPLEEGWHPVSWNHFPQLWPPPLCPGLGTVWILPLPSVPSSTAHLRQAVLPGGFLHPAPREQARD